MKTLLSVLWCLLPLLAFGDVPESATWLSTGLASNLTKFKRTTIVPHPERNGVIAINGETDPAWWGEVTVLHATGDKVDWIANFPKVYFENHGHYVLSCEWRYLEKLKLWVLEIFDSTHMGNGSLYLFTLDGHDLRLLLATKARGHFLEEPPGLVIPPDGSKELLDEHLTAEYLVLPGTKVESVVLTGTMAALDLDDKQVATKAYSEVWAWDAAKRVFVKKPAP